jgi:biopolymer transport protein ExbD
MAEIQQTNGHGRNKTRQKKANLRVDFTPMVDMNMLLITFFMLATTMTKPQTMKITMPADSQKPPTNVPKSKAVTVYLGKNHSVYYFMGEPNLNKPNYLTSTNFSSEGLRKILLDKNKEIINQMKILNAKKSAQQISKEDYEESMHSLEEKISIVLIKPLNTSTYNDMVNALDEMLITDINKYMIAKLDDKDKVMLKNSSIEFNK